MLQKIGSTFMQRWRIVVAIVAGLAVLAVLANVFLSFQANNAAKRFTEALADKARVEFESPRASWNGDVEVRSLRVTPLGRARASTLTAGRAVLHTPGVGWLTRMAFGAMGKPLPPASTLGLTLEELGVGGGNGWLASSDWLGITSAAPFEALGCSDRRRFEPSELTEMGLAAGSARLDVRYNATAPDRAELVATLNVPGSSHAEHTRQMRMADATRPLSASAADVAVLEQSWAVRDDGFVQARNRRCAQRARLTRGQYVERHLRLLDRWLASRGLVADPDLMAEYAHYAAQGGVMKWRSKPTTPMTLAQLQELPPTERMAALNAAFIADGRRAVAFRFTEYTAATVEKTGTEVASDATTGSAETAAGAPGTTAAVTGDVAGASAAAGSDASLAAATPTTEPAAAVGTTPTAPIAAAPTPAPAAEPPPAAAQDPALAPTAAAPIAETSATPASQPAASAPPEAVATTEQANAAPAKPARPPVLRPGRVEYEQLENAVGRQISLKTTFGSRRGGTLEKYNRRAITLRLSMREGGVPLTVPRETIATIELLGN